jgi:hypothetical protein
MSILFYWATNLPFQDDYEMILAFLNQRAAVTSVPAKAACFLGAKFNEYKVFFAYAIVWHYGSGRRADSRAATPLCADDGLSGGFRRVHSGLYVPL